MAFDAARARYFWPKVDQDGPLPEGRADLGLCWVWTGARNAKGYGQLASGRPTSYKAHRFAYELLVGPIPEGAQVDHLCRNASCVNPEHLEPVTPVENVMRGESFAARNARKTHCKRGHALTPENSYGYKGRRQCKTCARAAARRPKVVSDLVL